MTGDGVIVIQADSHRTQTANRRDAVARLVELLRAAVRKPRTRKPTHVSRAEKRRRLETKRQRGLTKRLRRATDEM
jgi:ribosome-associated protein